MRLTWRRLAAAAAVGAGLADASSPAVAAIAFGGYAVFSVAFRMYWRRRNRRTGGERGQEERGGEERGDDERGDDDERLTSAGAGPRRDL